MSELMGSDPLELDSYLKDLVNQTALSLLEYKPLARFLSNNRKDNIELLTEAILNYIKDKYSNKKNTTIEMPIGSKIFPYVSKNRSKVGKSHSSAMRDLDDKPLKKKGKLRKPIGFHINFGNRRFKLYPTISSTDEEIEG